MGLKWRSTMGTLALVASCVVFSGVSAQAGSESYVCNHPDVLGGWGALDLGCDADQFGDLNRIEYIYPKYVYDRRIKDVAHEQEYITNMNALIRKVAHDYYVQRVPHASTEELNAWMRAAVAIGAHESMLSHYRVANDGLYKLMTGDHLVSHGVMQVNQEFHANKELDSSFDLVGNIVGALDTYFVDWNRAINESCYKASNGKHPTADLMYSNRARSAYSAYNGGPGRLCRYTDRKSVYKAHDDAFLTMYRDQPWFKYVTDPKRVPSLNTKCLIEGDDLCAVAKPLRADYIKSRPLLLADGKTCVTDDGKNYSCATDMRIFSCLAKIDPSVIENDPLKMDKVPAGAKVTVLQDREPLCMKAVEGLYRVGTIVILQKEILMRESIGGAPIGNTRAGRVYQIQDYDLRLGGETDRYYKITTASGSEGWIYGGSNKDHATWIVKATQEQIEKAEKSSTDAKALKLAKEKEAIAKRLAEAKVAAAKAADAKNAKNKSAKNAKAAPVAPMKPAAQGALKVATADDDDTAPVLPVKGSVIEITKKDGIVLHATPINGEDKSPVDLLQQGAHLTVEEVQVKGTENQIFLKVSEGGKTGWIYVGRTFPDLTVTQWIKLWK